MTRRASPAALAWLYVLLLVAWLAWGQLVAPGVIARRTVATVSPSSSASSRPTVRARSLTTSSFVAPQRVDARGAVE